MKQTTNVCVCICFRFCVRVRVPYYRLLLLAGVSPNFLAPDLWGRFCFTRVSASNSCCRSSGSNCFGRCQPQTLAARSLGPVCFWKVSAPNSCCRISGARKVSAPNSCCRISGASLFFGRCQPQTPAAGSLGPVCFLGVTVSAPKLLRQDLWGQFVFERCQPQTLAAGSVGPACLFGRCSPKCCRMIGVSCVFWKGSAPNAANFESSVASVAAAGLFVFLAHQHLQLLVSELPQ